jgi:hypothetical protein
MRKSFVYVIAGVEISSRKIIFRYFLLHFRCFHEDFYKEFISTALARNVRRNLSDEIRSNGIFRTVSWVWNSIANWRVPKVKNPRSDPFNYYRNSGHKGYSVRPSPSKQKRQKTRRRPRPKQRQGPQTDSLQTQRNWNFKRRLRHDDTYYSAYVNSFYQ